MRHINPNMVVPVLEGIADGEDAVGSPSGDYQLAEQVGTAEELSRLLTPTQDRPFVIGAFLKSKDIAYCQGWIAAYRAGMEFS